VDFDLIVRGGLVVDGSPAATPRPADVGIRGEQITAVGALPDARAPVEIAAKDRVVAPGFIDPHVHSEMALRGNADRFGALLQGVTTHLTGADGFGWAGLPDDDAAALWRSTAFAYGDADARPSWRTPVAYLDSFSDLALNVAAMAPHQAIRFAALGWDARPATPDELLNMRRATKAWMEAGALGLATGLDYQPAASASTDELVALCDEVASFGGLYAPHQRYNEIGRTNAFAESIEVGRRAGIRVAIAHESIDDETEPILAEATSDADVSIDWYLYPAGSTHLLSLLPIAEMVGGPDAVRDRLADPDYRRRAADLLEASLAESRSTGAREYFSATRTGRHIGRSIAEIAAERGKAVGETAVDLMIEEMPDALLVYLRGTPADAFAAITRRTLAWPNFMVASDGIYHGARPHPRGFGCFARVLGEFVRRGRVLTLGDAVHRMSGLAAQRYGLRDRGRLEPGFAADLVVFDPVTVDGPASWEDPRRPPIGIDAVIVNGTLAVDHGAPTGQLAGQVLRRGA
jgi:N-acyl-D-amino-acid deacylase